MEKTFAAALKNLTAEDIELMARAMEDAGMCLDFLDDPYMDGTYKTDEEKARAIVETYVNEIQFIMEFKGEYADDYRTRIDYVLNYAAFEKDYFSSWLEGCAEYPVMCEIREFCECVESGITMWERAVEKGWIDPEAGWAEEGEYMETEDDDGLKNYWAYDAADEKWYLWTETEDGEKKIAEVGQDEDGTYYWIECESQCGYGDYDTLNEAKAAAEEYFAKH